jgi:GntR family transcriptional regulator
MNRTLHVDPSDATPIWRQIEEGIRRLVATGALTAGAPVPSVRDLARDLRVNPATVAKAYQRLVDARMLMVRRGEGTFVAEAPPVMENAERQKLLREGAVRYAAVAITIGASIEEAVTELQQIMVENLANTNPENTEPNLAGDSLSDSLPTGGRRW